MHSFPYRLNACTLLVLTLRHSLSLAAQIHKRDNAVNVGSTISIPVSMDSSARYTVNVNMSSGPVAQPFGLALSTGTGYTMVAGANCDSCDGVATYNASASTSATSWAGPQSVDILNSTMTDTTYKDDCGLQKLDGSVWEYHNQTIVAANASSPFFSDKVSGILGLGTNSAQGDFSDTLFGNYFRTHSNVSSLQYGMAINAPDNSTAHGGVLHWISPDPDFYTGDVSWKDVMASSSSANNTVNVTRISPDWMVQLDGWKFSGAGGIAGLNNNQGGPCSVDPYYPNLYIPFDLAHEIYAGVPQAAQLPQPDSGAMSQTWSIPCDAKMSFSASFGPQSFSIDESVLVINQGSTCVGAIQGWSDSSLTGYYLFGARFLSQAYLIFNVNNLGVSSPNTIGFAQRSKSSSSSSSSTGIIVGSVIGGVTFLVVASLVAWLFYRRTQRRRKAIQSETPRGPSQPGSSQPPAMSDHWASISHSISFMHPFLPSSPSLIALSSQPSPYLSVVPKTPSHAVVYYPEATGNAMDNNKASDRPLSSSAGVPLAVKVDVPPRYSLYPERPTGGGKAGI